MRVGDGIFLHQRESIKTDREERTWTLRSYQSPSRMTPSARRLDKGPMASDRVIRSCWKSWRHRESKSVYVKVKEEKWSFHDYWSRCKISFFSLPVGDRERCYYGEHMHKRSTIFSTPSNGVFMACKFEYHNDPFEKIKSVGPGMEMVPQTHKR